MDEEHLAGGLELLLKGVAPGDDRLGRDAGAREARQAAAGGKGEEPPAGRRDDLQDPLVVGVAKIRMALELAGRRGRDEGDVDAGAIEEPEALLGQVRREIRLEGAFARQLEQRAAEARGLAPALERQDEPLRPEVLMDVDGSHAGAGSGPGRDGPLNGARRAFCVAVAPSGSADRQGLRGRPRAG